MSECARVARARLLAAAAIIACAVPAVARGQAPASDSLRQVAADSVAKRREAVDAALRALVPLWRAATRDYEQFDSAFMNRLPTERLRVGAFTVLTDPVLLTTVQAALDRAWPPVHDTFGPGADSILGSRTFVIRQRVNTSVTADTVIDLAELKNGALEIFDRTNSRAKPELLASLIMVKSGRLIFEGVDSTFLLWLRGPLTPEMDRPAIRERLYVDLVTQPSQAVGRCLAGDILRCREALGLSTPADPLTEWYSARERQQLVIKLKSVTSAGANRESYGQCVEHDAFSACDNLLRSMHDAYVPPPLSPEARHNVVRLAIDMGGDGAYQRLVAGNGRTPGERLSAAAGAPIDSVVSQWRSGIVAAAPKSQRLSAGTAWATIAWGAFFGILALGSRRWS